MPQLTCLKTSSSLSISSVVSIIYVHFLCSNKNVSIVVIIYCISTLVHIHLYVFYISDSDFLENVHVYIDFNGGQSDER